MDLERFRERPVLGILRGASVPVIEPLTETCIASGLLALEITMNTPGAALQIQKAAEVARGRLAVGAGTVLDLLSLEEALKAGATFIVMPVLVSEVVRACVRDKIPVFPGALTPKEIFEAWEAGASMVKVFPAKFFGPAYFSEVKGPFNDVELLACGGVTAANAGEYMRSGASAVAFGGNVFKKERLEKEDFESISRDIKEVIAGVS